MTALVRVDFVERRLVLAPGTSAKRVLPLPDELIPNSRIRSIELHRELLQIGLPDGSEAVVEMGGGQSTEELRAARPVVYLDQNHWSSVGAARTGERPVPAEVREAAEWIAARADAGEILLPISAGRLVETGRCTVAVARRSRPRCCASVAAGRCATRSSCVGRSSRRRWASRQTGAVFVPGMTETFASSPDGAQRLVTWALALYEALLEPEQVEDPDGVGAKAKQEWSQKWVPIAKALRDDGAGSDVVSRATRANLLLDAADDLAAVGHRLGLQPQEVTERLMQSGAIESQPMLSLMLQVLTARLHNAEERPEPGDLFDFVYLPCAAAYADVLVGERRMIGYLRGARRPPAKAALASTLPQAVVHIRRLLRQRVPEPGLESPRTSEGVPG